MPEIMERTVPTRPIGAVSHPGAVAASDRPWEPQLGETAKAYAAFEVYRDLGPGRSITNAAKYLGKGVGGLADWSRKWNWVYRAACWDAEQRRLKAEDRDRARKEAVDRQGRVASLIIAQALKHIAAPETDAQGRKLTDEERRKWKPKPEALRMATYSLRYAAEVERLAMGLPTTITQTQQATEELVKEAQAAQRATIAIISEGLCEEPDCECCRRIRDRVGQALGYHARVDQRLTPATV